MEYQDEKAVNIDSRDHLRSFEEIGIGNPGKETALRVQARSLRASNPSLQSATKATRPQQLVRKAGGKLYIVKAEGREIQVRQTEFELQASRPRTNLMNDPPTIIEFDSTIAQGIWLQDYRDEGDYICSLFVPLVNKTIFQLFFTQDGLKLTRNKEPLVSIVHLEVPERPSAQGQGYTAHQKLVSLERMFYKNVSRELENEYSFEQTVLVNHGDDQVYIYGVPVCSTPTGSELTVSGTAIPLGSKTKTHGWTGLTSSLVSNFMGQRPQDSAVLEVLEDLKYLHHDLACVIVSLDDQEYEARLFNLVTGEILARLELTPPQTGTTFKVKIDN